jgi:hypothetical protein
VSACLGEASRVEQDPDKVEVRLLVVTVLLEQA